MQERKRALAEVWLVMRYVIFGLLKNASSEGIGLAWLKEEGLGEILNYATAILNSWFHKETAKALDLSAPVKEDVVYIAKCDIIVYEQE